MNARLKEAVEKKRQEAERIAEQTRRDFEEGER